MEQAILHMLKSGPKSGRFIVYKLTEMGFWFPRWRAYGCMAALEDNSVVKRTVQTQKHAFEKRVYEVQRHIYEKA